MIIKIIKDPVTNDCIFQFCLEWIDALAREDYITASSYLRNLDSEWHDAEIKQAVETYGSMEYLDETIYTVSRFEDAAGDNPRFSRAYTEELEGFAFIRHPKWPIEICWNSEVFSSEGVVATVHMDYALNGEWSDLSSNFDLIRAVDGVTVELRRLDVF